ncbi:MAG TPA: TonB-dependent receptor, partial [Thermoanaerobaculia bacterium]|nr:TonB-dependent receptor [Thermoanaerobaculia bacterium]
MNERRMRSGACRAAAIASFAASLLLVPVRARSADPDASLGGRITGTVLDPKGNPVAGAPVEASGAAPAAPRTSATDARGKFRFDGLPPGRYRIRAGDAHCVLGADVEVEAGRESVVEGVLGAGCRREKVDVAAPAPRYSAIDATTATKTDTPIMETPVSVQVVPQQVLQDQQATRLDKAVQNVSGVIPVTAGFQSSDDYVIRGFDNFAVSYENGLKLDEYTVSGFYRDMANVERVEIVKGPASVLYGQAEPGGLVNVVTKKPLDAPRYAFELQAGSFGTYRGTIDATGPLNEAHSLLYRLNLSYENAGSFRDFVSGERFFVFPTLQWKPGAADEVTLELKYANGFVIGDNGVPFAADGRPADVPVSRNYAEPDANRAPTTEYALKLGATHDFGSGWSLRAAYRLEYRKSPTPNGQFYQGPA